MKLEKSIELAKDALIGQAVGDAFGVPVEFLFRKQVRCLDLRDMVGADSEETIDSWWGTKIPAGSWSDDTSMTLASMGSFIQNRGKVNDADQMKQFTRWWDIGEYCCLSYPFGLGENVSAALQRYKEGTPALECGGRGFRDNGNGALMRILPFSLYCIFNGLGTEETVKITGNGSALTHGHEISRMCCFIWTEFLRSLSEGTETDEAIDRIENLPYADWFQEETLQSLKWITEKRARELTEKDIGETGYVVDTLHAALYSMIHAKDFETAIRNAVNLGYDTDTAAAVTGTASGILYGRESIPPRWMEKLRKREMLEDIAEEFAKCLE